MHRNRERGPLFRLKFKKSMSDLIKIVLVDDHRIFRDGIKSLLSEVAGLEIIGETSTGEEALAQLKGLCPDVLILDVSLPGISGISVAQQVSTLYPAIKIMILSMHTDEDFIIDAVRAGVQAYLPKDTSKEELIEALETINSGGEYFSKLISEQFLKSFLRRKRMDQDALGTEDLTPREYEILKLCAAGMSNKEIGDKLCISSKTVDTHRAHILQKLKLRNTAELVIYAVKNNLIKIS